MNLQQTLIITDCEQRNDYTKHTVCGQLRRQEGELELIIKIFVDLFETCAPGRYPTSPYRSGWNDPSWHRELKNYL